MKDIIIAIDGYSGTGKSSTARAVASLLRYRYVDSGAMYRAVTYYFMQNPVDYQDDQAVKQSLAGIDLDIVVDEEGNSEILLDGKPLGNLIRTSEVNQHVSTVAAVKLVRRDLVARQQAIGRHKEIVMDGRDIGTVVFPNAELKIFMTAEMNERTMRRFDELREMGIESDMQEIRNNLRKRDLIDSSREEGPLKKAKDAIELDTTLLTFEQQVQYIVKLAKEIIT